MGASEDGYDSQGKTKHLDFRTRTSLLALAFVIGLTLGVVISQRLYIEANRGDGSPALAVRGVVKQDGEGHHRIVSTHMAPGALCGQVDGNCELEAYLQKIAPQKEVLVAISNFDLVRDGGKLTMWIDCVQKAKVPNYMVLAIDHQLHEYLDNLNVPNFLMETQTSAAQAGTGSNHAVSALKFGLLEQFLKLGWNVLLSDVDIATFDNPFNHLYRDRDIEGMTDGFDDATAYGFIDGFDDPSMGWARYAQATKHFNLNSGLFYTRANNNTIALMHKLADRLDKAKYWDQSAFNEEIFFLSHGDTTFIPISVRVMDYWKFMNSKVLFKRWRHMKPRPTGLVMAHMNYHPDKGERMRAIIEYMQKGDDTALMRFPGGSEPGS